MSDDKFCKLLFKSTSFAQYKLARQKKQQPTAWWTIQSVYNLIGKHAAWLGRLLSAAGSDQPLLAAPCLCYQSAPHCQPTLMPYSLMHTGSSAALRLVRKVTNRSVDGTLTWLQVVQKARQLAGPSCLVLRGGGGRLKSPHILGGTGLFSLGLCWAWSLWLASGVPTSSSGRAWPLRPSWRRIGPSPGS